ncbi:MAG TPA: hypothetical protein VJU61_01940, partial [Polyangiaceae bacterium]|nr:hypothetical protein [Polyangiaceae bacterium]
MRGCFWAFLALGCAIDDREPSIALVDPGLLPVPGAGGSAGFGGTAGSGSSVAGSSVAGSAGSGAAPTAQGGSDGEGGSAPLGRDDGEGGTGGANVGTSPEPEPEFPAGSCAASSCVADGGQCEGEVCLFRCDAAAGGCNSVPLRCPGSLSCRVDCEAPGS